MHGSRWCLVLLALVFASAARTLADQPQWGERFSRNMVSDERGLPDSFDPGERGAGGHIDLATTRNVRWIARLGNRTHGSPIIAGGRVFVGTNNSDPRDARFQGDRGVLACFDEKSGEFLWELNLPKMTSVKWGDWHHVGFSSPPTVEGDRAYAVTNRCEVVCLDVKGMADGNDGPFTDEARLLAEEGQPPVALTERDGDILWRFDMYAELGVEPHNASNCSVLLLGDHLYINTSNGVEWTHKYVKNPEAPSVIVLDKHTGRLLARDDFGIGGDITHGQWSSLATGVVNGERHVYFGAGNGYLYAFKALPEDFQPGDKPALLENVWRLMGHPLAQTQDHVPPDHQHDSTSYQVTANPVFYKDRVYVVFTQEAFHGMNEGWLVSIDATRTGDITRTGILWSYDLGSSVSTPSIAGGLLYVCNFAGGLHCLDADTGELYWKEDLGGPIWGSTLAADGKLYLGTGRQRFYVYAQGKQPQQLSEIRLPDQMLASPTAANGVLYIPACRYLFAVAAE